MPLLPLVTLLVGTPALSTACPSTSITPQCMRALFADEVAGWSAGRDTLIGRASKKLNGKLPRGLLELQGTGFLEEAPIPDACTKEFESSRECFVAIMSSIEDACSGQVVPELDAAIKDRLQRWKSFRSDEGYQRAHWGMTVHEVRKLYPKAKNAKEDVLMLRDSVADKAADVTFTFARGRLAQVAVVFLDHYMNPNNYVSDYEGLKALLQKKYGQPTGSNVDWSQTRNHGDPERLGTAVALGQATMHTEWSTTASTVLLLCTGEQAQARVELNYSSSQLAGLMSVVNEAAAMRDL